MQLFAVRFGESSLKSKYIYQNLQPDCEDSLRISWSFYVAKLGTDVIFFDVGFRDQALAKQWGITLFDINEELAALIGEAQHSLVVITHSDFDHIDNLDLFPNSVPVIISEKEYERAMNDASPSVKERLLINNVSTIKDEAVFYNRFTYKVIGGHTIGSSVIYFQHQGKKYVITGDECYTCNNLTDQRPIGVFYNTHHNAAFLAQGLKQGLEPLPFHDIELFNRYPNISEHIVQII